MFWTIVGALLFVMAIPLMLSVVMWIIVSVLDWIVD